MTAHPAFDYDEAFSRNLGWVTEWEQLALRALDIVDHLHHIVIDALYSLALLRHHVGELAIRAAQQGDFSVVQSLHQVLRTPFDDHPAHRAWADFPPDWASSIAISCSWNSGTPSASRPSAAHSVMTDRCRSRAAMRRSTAPSSFPSQAMTA